MDAIEVKKIIKKEKLVPILRIQKSDKIMDIVDAVVGAKSKILELTMTINGILPYISKIKSKYPDLVLGLGTVFSIKDAEEAIKQGIDFIVSPILNHEIVNIVKSHNKMLMLSGFTPTEIYNAYKAGADIVKLFPATEMSPTFIKEIKGPMPYLDIFPTGGLNLISAIQFLSCGALAVGIGSAIFKPEWIETGKFEDIFASMGNAIRRIRNMAI